MGQVPPTVDPPAPLSSDRSFRVSSSPRAKAQAAMAVIEDLSLVRRLGQKVAYGDGLSPEIRCVLAEACLQRVVRLVRFFYDASGSGDSLKAQDFVRDPKAWLVVRPAMPGVIASHLGQMEDLVDPQRWPHLESGRSLRCWPFSSFAGELERLMESFEEQLASEPAAWFQTARRRSPAVH